MPWFMSNAWCLGPPTYTICQYPPPQMAPQPRVTMSRLVTCHVSRVGSVPVSRVRVAGMWEAGDHWQCGARPGHRPMVSVGDQPSWRLHPGLHSQPQHLNTSPGGHANLLHTMWDPTCVGTTWSVETDPASPKNQVVDVVDIAKCPLGNKNISLLWQFLLRNW